MKNILFIMVTCFLLGHIGLRAQSNTFSASMYDSVFICNQNPIFISGSKQFVDIMPQVENMDTSLCSIDHTAAGFMVTLQDSSIIHFFRLDPGITGHHIGDSAFIAKRISYDDGQTWTNPVFVYDDPYWDDRNIAGGLIGTDSIVIFFRKYSAQYGITVSLNYIVSIDGGYTWSPVYNFPALPGAVFSPHKLIYVPTRGYMTILYDGISYVEIRFSENGIDWSQNNGYVWEFSNSNYKVNECYFSYLGDGKLIGLMRDGLPGLDATLYQVTSEDYGQTWTLPVHTNIAAPYFSAAPLIFYDNEKEDLWVVATDRRNFLGHPFYATGSCVWIYKNKIEDIFYNPTNHQLFTSFLRPVPNYHMFYGYPVVTQKSDNNYLIVFIESYDKPGGLEEADFYQFEINYNPVAVDATEFMWSTGSTDETIQVAATQFYHVEQSDQLGHWSHDSVFVSIIEYELANDFFSIEPGQDIQAEVLLDSLNPAVEVFWSNGLYDNPMVYFPTVSVHLYVNISNDYHTCIDSIEIMVNNPVLFDEILNGNSFSGEKITISPNPVETTALVSFDNPEIKAFILSIYDQNGKLVKQLSPVYENTVFDRDNLRPGTYLLVLSDQQNTFSTKIILN